MFLFKFFFYLFNPKVVSVMLILSMSVEDSVKRMFCYLIGNDE